VPNAQVYCFNNVWFIFFSFSKKHLIFFYMFSIFIIILYNKNKVSLIHFYIFIYLDASLKFEEKRRTSFYLK
jgi:hypothetical protein